MGISLYTTEECEKIAELASLRYVTDKTPGITRKRRGKGFAYYQANGQHISDAKIVKRINSLAIPPAYQNVWISPYANGHIQATGRDDRRRKQYIYHPLWTQKRQQQKFNLLLEFGQVLPEIRKHIKAQLNKPLNMSKEQIICAIIYLLDHSSIRIGNDIYSRENKSYGLTTLRKKHLSIEDNIAFLDFKGKSAQIWHVMLKDKKIIKILKKCEELPGYELFKYQDDKGQSHVITSQDVNSYLQSLTQQSFTAKDFRTWNASREVFNRLINNSKQDECSSAKVLKAIISEVALLLGHTASVCQKNYIHPEIVSGWNDNILMHWIAKNDGLINTGGDQDEVFLLWLQER